MASTIAWGTLTLLLLGLAGGVGGVSLPSRQHGGLSSQGAFRSIDVPYHLLVAPRGAVSSLLTNLSLGNLLAYVPAAPVTDDLLVFLPGSTQPCGEYSQLLETIAGSILALCLPYDNRATVATLCGSDGGCYPDLRLEAFNGSFNDVSGNNIELRLVSALRYLSGIDGAFWSSYLDASSSLPRWSRIRVAGHSQGAGAAAFIGYYRKVARVVQFSGVCDQSEWTARLGPPVTPANRFFGFASRWDAMCKTFTAQLFSWRNEGALPPGAAPLELTRRTDITGVSLNGTHVVISDLLPPGCSMADTNTPSCSSAAHASTAQNLRKESPYADGVWQELCGI